MSTINRKCGVYGRGVMSSLFNFNPTTLPLKFGLWATKQGFKQGGRAALWGTKKVGKLGYNTAKLITKGAVSAAKKANEVIKDKLNPIDKTKFHKEPQSGNVTKNNIKYKNKTDDIMMEDPLRFNRPLVNDNKLETGKHLQSKIKNSTLHEAISKLPKKDINIALKDVEKIKKSNLPEEKRNKTLKQLASAFDFVAPPSSYTKADFSKYADKHKLNDAAYPINEDVFHDAEGRRKRRRRT